MTVRIAALVILAACGGKTAPGGGAIGNQGEARAVDRSIRTVDWKRFTYVTDDGVFAVVDGKLDFVYDDAGVPVTRDEFARRYPGQRPEERGSFTVEGPAFGDVDRDGVEEAAITSSLWGGGSGHFSTVWIYAMPAGAAVRLGAIEGGDRAAGGIASVAIGGDGAVLVDRFETDAGACCPERVAHETWRWDGHGFAEDRSARRVEAAAE